MPKIPKKTRYCKRPECGQELLPGVLSALGAEVRESLYCSTECKRIAREKTTERLRLERSARKDQA